MLKVLNVVGARPNFMKVAPIVAAMRVRARRVYADGCAYRAALRCGNVRHFTRSGFARAGCLSWHRFGHARGANRKSDAGRLSRFFCRIQTGLGVGGRRREFDARVRAGVRENRRQSRARRSGFAFA